MEPLNNAYEAILAEQQHATLPPKETAPACVTCGDARWLNNSVPQGEKGFGEVTRCPTCLTQEEKMSMCGLANEILPGSDWDWFNPELQPTEEAKMEAAALKMALIDWVRSKGKRWLLISGAPGIGKSDLVKTAVWLAFCANQGGTYLTAYEFDKRIKDFKDSYDDRKKEGDQVYTHPDKWLEQFATRKRLALDDVGAGYSDRSGYVKQRFEQLFDIRYRMKLPTLVTTNMTSKEFQQHVGYRVWSRLWDSQLSEVIECHAMQDVRPMKRGN